MIRKEIITSHEFSGLNFQPSPMLPEEFALIMGCHRRWNLVDSEYVEGRDKAKGLSISNDGYIKQVRGERKQCVLALNESMNFEISSFAILIPNSGPFGPVDSDSSLSFNQGLDSGLFRSLKEIKKYVAEFDRARSQWDLLSGEIGLVQGKFERHIDFGRTCDPCKIRRWKLPTSDSEAEESFRRKVQSILAEESTIQHKSWGQRFYRHKAMCDLLREASYCYPGLALDCKEFVELVKHHLVKCMLKQITMFTRGESLIDEIQPLQQFCDLINEFHLPTMYGKPSHELKLPIVTTILTQGSNLPVNFVNLVRPFRRAIKKGAVILNMETRTLVTDDFSKYKPIFDFTSRSNSLTGWITGDIMKSLTDAKVAILEHADFKPLDVSPMVKLSNPFPVIESDLTRSAFEASDYKESKIGFGNKVRY